MKKTPLQSCESFSLNLYFWVTTTFKLVFAQALLYLNWSFCITFPDLFNLKYHHRFDDLSQACYARNVYSNINENITLYSIKNREKEGPLS